MEPLSEQELNQLLKTWQAPNAPLSLKAPRRQRGWRWLLTGSIRVPVPIGAVILILLAIWVYLRQPAKPSMQAPLKPVSLADFQPVKELQPKVIGRANEGN